MTFDDHVRSPQDCPVCYQLAGGPKLYEGERAELHPVIEQLHNDAVESRREGDPDADQEYRQAGEPEHQR